MRLVACPNRRQMMPEGQHPHEVSAEARAQVCQPNDDAVLNRSLYGMGYPKRYQTLVVCH
jgi:hypothetical protein